MRGIIIKLYLISQLGRTYTRATRHTHIRTYIQVRSINPFVLTHSLFLAHSFFFCPGNKNKSCSQRAYEKKKDWTGKRWREPKRVVCWGKRKKKRVGYTSRYSPSPQSADFYFCNPYSRPVFTASTWKPFFIST